MADESTRVVKRPKLSPRRTSRSWRAEKSDKVRNTILHAGIDCLYEKGYAATSTADVANKAGVSRGSLQYHFYSKIDLMEGIIQHINMERLNNLKLDLRRAPKDRDVLEHLIEVHWRHLNEKEFIAYQELTIASRTDDRLSSLMQPAYKAFRTRWREICIQHVPEWSDFLDETTLAANAAQYMLEGMAFGYINRQLDEEEVEELIELIKMLVVRHFERASAGKKGGVFV